LIARPTVGDARRDRWFQPIEEPEGCTLGTDVSERYLRLDIRPWPPDEQRLLVAVRTPMTPWIGRQLLRLCVEASLKDVVVLPHSEAGVAPRTRWEAHGFLPRLPDSLEQLDLLPLTVAKPRRVHQDGIHFQGFRYLDVPLAARTS
jgi:hypothetical protein